MFEWFAQVMGYWSAKEGEMFDPNRMKNRIEKSRMVGFGCLASMRELSAYHVNCFTNVTVFAKNRENIVQKTIFA